MVVVVVVISWVMVVVVVMVVAEVVGEVVLVELVEVEVGLVVAVVALVTAAVVAATRPPLVVSTRQPPVFAVRDVASADPRFALMQTEEITITNSCGCHTSYKALSEGVLMLTNATLFQSRTQTDLGIKCLGFLGPMPTSRICL